MQPKTSPTSEMGPTFPTWKETSYYLTDEYGTKKTKRYKVIPSPHNYRILVTLEQAVEEKTKGGIYLPEEAKADYNHLSSIARVVSLGPNAFKEQYSAPRIPQIDELVFLNKHAQSLAAIDGVQPDGKTVRFLAIGDDHILAYCDTTDPTLFGRV